MVHRHVLLAVALVQDLLIGGVLFGWSALQLILLREGMYSERCSAAQRADARDGDESEFVCNEQELAVALLFTIGSFTGTCSSVVMGVVLDRLGPKICTTSGAVLAAVGALLVALSTAGTDMMLPGVFLIALGGPGLHIAFFQIANLYPGNESKVTSAFAGIFGSSTIVFVIFNAIHAASDGGVSRRDLFLAYAVIILLIALSSLFLWPMRPYEKRDVTVVMDIDTDTSLLTADDGGSSSASASAPSASSSSSSSSSASGSSSASLSSSASATMLYSVSSSAAVKTVDEDEAEEEGMSGSAGPAPSFLSQVRTPMYAYVALFMCIHVLRNTVFFGTVNSQMDAKDGDAGPYIAAYGIFLPLSVVCVPVIGWAMDKHGTDVGMFLTNIVAVVYSIFLMLPWLEVQPVTFLTFSVANQFLFATFFSAIAREFGFANYGRIAGATTLLAALLGLLIYPINALAIGPLERVWWPINLALLLVLLPFAGWNFVRVWRAWRAPKEPLP